MRHQQREQIGTPVRIYCPFHPDHEVERCDYDPKSRSCSACSNTRLVEPSPDRVEKMTEAIKIECETGSLACLDDYGLTDEQKMEDYKAAAREILALSPVPELTRNDVIQWMEIERKRHTGTILEDAFDRVLHHFLMHKDIRIEIKTHDQDTLKGEKHD